MFMHKIRFDEISLKPQSRAWAGKRWKIVEIIGLAWEQNQKLSTDKK